MSIKDVIKSSVYEKFAGGTGLSIYETLLILALACVIGVYIFFVYKMFTHSEFYSKEFNISLVGMSIVVAAIMIAMQSNLLVSLGMVGALSIVRFRTAVKSPLDLLYLFWSISAGIICGVGLYVLALVLCFIMTLAIWLLGRVKISKAPGLLVIKMDEEADADAVFGKIKEGCKYNKLKSSSIKRGQREVIYEISSADVNALVKAIDSVEGVSSTSYVEHDGEFRG